MHKKNAVKHAAFGIKNMNNAAVILHQDLFFGEFVHQQNIIGGAESGKKTPGKDKPDEHNPDA